MQRINTSSSSGFQPGVVTLWGSWTIFKRGCEQIFYVHDCITFDLLRGGQ